MNSSTNEPLNQAPTESTVVINSSTNEPLNQASTESPEVSQPIKLLSLNYDCLDEILAHLSNVDLLNMCIASDRLKETILNCDLRKRQFDFSEFCSCQVSNVFEIFGQHMINIKISERDILYELNGISEFDEILRLIAAYCSLDTIKHLDIQYYYTSRLKKRFIYNAIPFFRRIESFAISETDGYDGESCVDYFRISRKYCKSVNEFIERLLMQAVNVNSIKLNCVKVTGRFLHLPLSNLKKLLFINCNVRDSLGIFSFLDTKPNLMQFTWIGSSVLGMDDGLSNSSDYIFDAVTNNLTDLETFEFHKNEIYIYNSNKIIIHSTYKDIDVQLINNFRKLGKLAISQTSFELWKMLEKKDTLKKISSTPHFLYNSESRTDLPSLYTEYQDFQSSVRLFRYIPLPWFANY